MFLYFYIYGNMKTETAIETLAALAQETRLQIFRALVQAHAPDPDQAGLSAGALADTLGVPAPTLSFHLKELSRANLLASRKEGRSIIYSANLGAMAALTDFLLEDCCQGACGASFSAQQTLAASATEKEKV